MQPTLRKTLLAALRRPLWLLPDPVALKAYRVLHGPFTSSEAWVNTESCITRLPIHGFNVSLDLSDWVERMAFFTGRYYDLVGPRVVRHLLRSGDTLLDVGANIGMLALVGARAVTPGGRVFCFEPNPALRELLSTHRTLNRITEIEILEDALSDESGEAILSLPHDHTGTGTLRPVSDAQKTFSVRLRRGDDFADRVPEAGYLLIKVDVEGHEFKALSGMQTLLARPNVSVLVEITPEWLQSGGSSAEALFKLFRAHGMEAYEPRLRGLRELHFQHLIGPSGRSQYDVLFARPDDARLRRSH